MIIGIINGGLGLQLGDVPTRYIIAYSVVTGVTTLFYVASIALGWTRSSRGEKQSKVEPSVAQSS